MKTTGFILLAAITFASTAFAVFPPPDGGYPDQNTAEGEDALLNLTTGTDNTALGFNALLSQTTGSDDTAVGSQALANHTSSGGNVAIGRQALFSSQTGYDNIAIGDQALYENISGGTNVGVGLLALASNTTGVGNVAIGSVAARLTSGDSNTAVGYQTLYANEGSNNCAFGSFALGANTTNTGSNNTGIGTNALFINFGANNTALGYNAGGNISAGDNNIFIGINAGADIEGGDNNIDIGHQGVDGDNGIIRIGSKKNQKKTYIVGINGNTVAGGIGVIVGSDGRLGTTTSSARFKEDIKPMDNASEAVLSLKPVTFRYKKELDPQAIPQFGLVAEQVEKVDRELVAYDDEGKPYSVRYEAVNAMLLNEFLKEHQRVESLEKAMSAQQNENAAIRDLLKEQAAQLRRVSAQLALAASAPQTVQNNP
jgi:hypothetical protein